jgi:hypothetical protein
MAARAVDSQSSSARLRVTCSIAVRKAIIRCFCSQAIAGVSDSGARESRCDSSSYGDRDTGGARCSQLAAERASIAAVMASLDRVGVIRSFYVSHPGFGEGVPFDAIGMVFARSLDVSRRWDRCSDH